MKTELLCDNCKREFSGDEDLMEKLGEVICDECKEDREVELL